MQNLQVVSMGSSSKQPIAFVCGALCIKNSLFVLWFWERNTRSGVRCKSFLGLLRALSSFFIDSTLELLCISDCEAQRIGCISHYDGLLQHHQRFRLAAEGWTQDVLAEGVVATTQSQVSECVSPAAGVLCRAVPREGSIAHWTCHQVPTQVLAQDSLAQRGKPLELLRQVGKILDPLSPTVTCVLLLASQSRFLLPSSLCFYCGSLLAHGSRLPSGVPWLPVNPALTCDQQFAPISFVTTTWSRVPDSLVRTNPSRLERTSWSCNPLPPHSKIYATNCLQGEKKTCTRKWVVCFKCYNSNTNIIETLILAKSI